MFPHPTRAVSEVTKLVMVVVSVVMGEVAELTKESTGKRLLQLLL